MATFVIVFDGSANPTPAYTPVFIPITCPSIFNSGPPELPGLIAASVWIISGMENVPKLSSC